VGFDANRTEFLKGNAMPTITPNEFVNKWKRITSRERQAINER
jgi:hypothetical protein